MVPEATLEAVGPAAKPTGGWNHLSLVLLVGNDFGNFGLNVLGLGWLTSKSGQSSTSSFDVTSLDVVSGRVGEEEETTSKNDSPCELDTNGNSVLTSAGIVASTVNDTGGDQDTESDTELVSRNKSASDFLWALHRQLVAISERELRRLLTISDM